MNFRTSTTYQFLSWGILGKYLFPPPILPLGSQSESHTTGFSAIYVIASAGKHRPWINTARGLAFFILCTSLLLSIRYGVYFTKKVPVNSSYLPCIILSPAPKRDSWWDPFYHTITLFYPHIKSQLIHIATQLAWVGMEYNLYQSPSQVPEKGKSQVMCRIIMGFWLFTHTAILGTRSVHR